MLQTGRMSEKCDSQSQIRLWPENEKRVKEFLKTTGMPFSTAQLCNWIIANADFEGTAKDALTKGRK